MISSLLKRLPGEPFFLLLTVPSAIVLGVGLLPLPLIWLESDWPWLHGIAPAISSDTAQNVLSVIAAGAMTALSLAYSITLVVFTLAAGSIGPRLLKRFVTDRVSQITAGIFGGAFVYSMITLAFVTTEYVPGVAVLVAMFLGVHAVLQLVYFVRHVASSVSIDDEIAGIALRLTKALAERAARYAPIEDEPDGDAFEATLEAPSPGYVGAVDETAIVALAKELDIVIRLEASSGRFVLEGEPLLKASGKLDDDPKKAILDLIPIDPARSEAQQIEFSIHLLIEIGLRALSPGVNDPYTAIAVSDAISAALADTVKEDAKLSGLSDDEGAVRLIVPGLEAKAIVGQAYHPLRRAATDSILMCQALARAFGRLYVAGAAPVKEVMRLHAGLLVGELAEGGHLKRDIDSVLEFLPSALRDEIEDGAAETAAARD